MARIMILAPTIREGEEYAREHGLDRGGVISWRTIYDSRGRSFEGFRIVGNMRLDIAEWAWLAPLLLGAGGDVLDRFQYATLGMLPPPIELPREKVMKI